MVALLEIWTRYQDTLLVDLPTEDMFPITMEAFEHMQKTAVEKAHERLNNDWLDEVEEVFEQYVKEAGLTEDNSVKVFCERCHPDE